MVSSAAWESGSERIVWGSDEELSVICAMALPHVPAQWLRQRWCYDARWVDHTRRILADPTYLALHQWVTVAFASRPGEWSTLAATLVTHAPKVASGQWSPGQMRRRLARTVGWSSRDQGAAGGGSYRLQSRTGVVDQLAGDDTFDRCASPSAPAAAAGAEAAVIEWLVAAIGVGWLTPAARVTLSEGLDLAAEFVASFATRSGLDVLSSAVPAATTSPFFRLTRVLGHMPRAARAAIRCFVLGPNERTGVGGAANSLVVWSASERRPTDVPARLVAVWRYHAAMLEPEVAEVAVCEVSRDRLRRYAARAGQGPSVSVRDALGSDSILDSLSGRQHRDNAVGLVSAGSARQK